MTLKVEVTIPQDEVNAGAGAQYLEKAMLAIGFSRGVSLAMPDTAHGEDATAAPAVYEPSAKPAVEETPGTSDEKEDGDAKERLFGKAEEGRTRRLKVQIEEDEALAERLKAAGHDPAKCDGWALSKVEELLGGAGEPKPNISTGADERIDPANPDDQAQDAADEKAEVEATKGDGLTLDDLRQAAGAFQKKHGMAATMEKVPEILGCGLHEVPEDQIENAIAKLAAYEGEPETSEAEKTVEAPTATKDDLIAAMLDYAEKFDGQRTDTSAMPVLAEDRPKVLAAALGDEVDGLSKVPDAPEAYGKAVAAFREAIAKNPFGREVKK